MSLTNTGTGSWWDLHLPRDLQPLLSCDCTAHPQIPTLLSIPTPPHPLVARKSWDPPQEDGKGAKKVRLQKRVCSSQRSNSDLLQGLACPYKVTSFLGDSSGHLRVGHGILTFWGCSQRNSGTTHSTKNGRGRETNKLLQQSLSSCALINL